MPTDLHQITVFCGNGGDYEFERDRAWWSIWIKHRMPQAKHKIRPHQEADKAVITFDNVFDLLVFQLTKPEFISPSDLPKSL